MIREFKDILAWQKGHELVIKIYKITDSFPQKEVFALTNQIRRAVVSVTSNIAEGFGRKTVKEKLQFYYQAHGSLVEVENQLLISRDVGYVSKEIFNETMIVLVSVHRLMLALINKTKSFLRNPISNI